MTTSVLISASPKNSKGTQIPDYENTTYQYCNSTIHIPPGTKDIADGNYTINSRSKAHGKCRALSSFWTKAVKTTTKNRIIQDKAKHDKLRKTLTFVNEYRALQIC